MGAHVHVKDRITHPERQKFLELIRQGYNRAGAARRVNPDYTGTMFQKLCSTESSSYDHEFAVAYHQACAERGQPKFMSRNPAWRQSRKRSAHGKIRGIWLTPEQVDTFIDMVREGVPLRQAADQISTSLWQLNRLCENDEVFAARYADARRIGYPVMQENLRAEAYRQAMNGDYRALRDLNMIHLPEYGVLRDKKPQDISRADLVELITSKMGDLPPAVLDQMIHLIQTQQLEAGDDADDDGIAGVAVRPKSPRNPPNQEAA